MHTRSDNFQQAMVTSGMRIDAGCHGARNNREL